MRATKARAAKTLTAAASVGGCPSTCDGEEGAYDNDGKDVDDPLAFALVSQPACGAAALCNTIGGCSDDGMVAEACGFSDPVKGVEEELLLDTVLEDIEDDEDVSLFSLWQEEKQRVQLNRYVLGSKPIAACFDGGGIGLILRRGFLLPEPKDPVVGVKVSPLALGRTPNASRIGVPSLQNDNVLLGVSCLILPEASSNIAPSFNIGVMDSPSISTLVVGGVTIAPVVLCLETVAPTQDIVEGSDLVTPQSGVDVKVEEMFTSLESFVPTQTMEDGMEIDILDLLACRMESSFSNSLVGKFCTNHPNVDVVRRWMGQRWNLGGKVEVVAMLNNFFLFSFSNPNDCSRTLLDRPWSMRHNGLVLNHWTPRFNPLKEDTSKFLVWVQLPKLPSEF
ncbi:hypothetical protein SUGI_0603150 [Cryptomeria japonica]|nr:hypothetical protein SUGI_0603150 [Cryptomeria japonica]